MTLFDDKLLDGREDEAILAMAQTVRVRTLERAVVDSGGVLANTMDNRMLINDVSADAHKSIRTKQNDKAIDNQSANAELVSNVLGSLVGVNPFAGGGSPGVVIDASFDEVFPDKIDPDSITLGNVRLTLEDAGIDEELL